MRGGGIMYRKKGVNRSNPKLAEIWLITTFTLKSMANYKLNLNIKEYLKLSLKASTKIYLRKRNLSRVST